MGDAKKSISLYNKLPVIIDYYIFGGGCSPKFPSLLTKTGVRQNFPLRDKICFCS